MPFFLDQIQPYEDQHRQLTVELRGLLNKIYGIGRPPSTARAPSYDVINCIRVAITCWRDKDCSGAREILRALGEKLPSPAARATSDEETKNVLAWLLKLQQSISRDPHSVPPDLPPTWKA